MARTVADLIAETLQRAGVKRIYGVVGDSLNGFTDSLRRQKKIDWMHMRHEEAAAFAAGAEAHLTGELAVCAGSCGPGNLHLINGLFDCHRSRVPVLAIAAHIPSAEIGGGYFQETHPEQLFARMQPLRRAGLQPRADAARPRNGDPHRRSAERGVSVVVIPGDVALQTTAAKAGELAGARSRRSSGRRRRSRRAGGAAERRPSASRMLCGAGCAGAHAEVVALGGSAEGADRPRAARQGACRVRQSRSTSA